MPSARINPSAKQCKFDLDDKFGKFEIKSKMQGKHTKQLNLEWWSFNNNLIIFFFNKVFYPK